MGVEVGNAPHHGKPSGRRIQETSPERLHTEDMAQVHMKIETWARDVLVRAVAAAPGVRSGQAWQRDPGRGSSL